MLGKFRSLYQDSRYSKSLVAPLMLVLAAGMLAYLVPGGKGDAGTDPVVARAYGREILRRDLEERVRTKTQEMSQQFGRGVESMEKMIRRQVLNEMIREALMEELAERHGVTVTDADIQNALLPQIRQNPELVRPDGSIKSVAEINEWLAANARGRGAVTLASIERNMRKEMLVPKLVREASVRTPIDGAWLEEENRVRNEKIAYEEVTLRPEPTSVPDPGDAALEKVLKDGGTRFLQPVRRVLQVAYVDHAALGEQVKISDSELKAAYEQRKATYEQGPQVKARHILFKADQSNPALVAQALQKAMALRAKLVKGQDFAKAAEENSEDPSAKGRGGDLGWFERGRMVKAFSDAAFALKPGEISQPVQSEFGIHLIKVEGVKPASTQGFDEVKDQLRRDLEDNRFATKAREKLEQVRKRAGNGDLSSAARSLGAKVAQSLPFAEGEPAEVEGVLEPGSFGSEAFRMKVGQASNPQKVGAGDAAKWVLYRVKEELAPSVPPLKEIRKKVLTAYQEDTARTQLRAKAEAALKGGDLKALEPLGGTPRLQPPASIQSRAEISQSPAIRQALLKAETGKPTPLLWAPDGRLWVAKVTERQPAPALTFEARKDLIQQLETDQAQRILGAEIQSLYTQGRLHPGLSSFWGHFNGIWEEETQEAAGE